MAIVNLNALSAEFPDNRIVLINGSELVCYPKVVQPDSYSEDRLSLDLSGTYFIIGSKPAVKVEKETTESKELKNFFYKNAFLFFRNAHRILSDSRMFLAPVPVQNGLAYTGTSGFRCPTLGVYIEWWLNCDANITKDKKGREALTCYVAGSPLSGSNHCTCVYPDGKVGDISHYPFSNVWRSFISINNRYTKAKQMYEAYTLTEVVDLLLAARESRESELETQLDIAKGKCNILKRQYSTLKERYDKLHDQYENLTVLYYKKELENFRLEYRRRKQNAEQEMESLASAKAEFKAQMKQGIINNIEYQHAVAPLTMRRKEIENELITFMAENKNALVQTGHLTCSQINDYIHQDDKEDESSGIKIYCCPAK